LKKDIFRPTDLIRTLLWVGLGVQVDSTQIFFITEEVKVSLQRISPTRSNLIRGRRISKLRIKKISNNLKGLIRPPEDTFKFLN
jgi:hypothetical protein